MFSLLFETLHLSSVPFLPKSVKHQHMQSHFPSSSSCSPLHCKLSVKKVALVPQISQSRQISTRMTAVKQQQLCAKLLNHRMKSLRPQIKISCPSSSPNASVQKTWSWEAFVEGAQCNSVLCNTRNPNHGFQTCSDNSFPACMFHRFWLKAPDTKKLNWMILKETVLSYSTNLWSTCINSYSACLKCSAAHGYF